MKKKLCVVLIFALAAALACVFVACNKGTFPELSLYVPDGAPALSVAKIIKDGKIADSDGTQKINSHVTTGEEVIAKCANGEADMAVLPTNAAVKICSTRSDYQLYSVNVYGVLYIVGREPISSVSELVGKRLYSIGLGNTPEYVFETICDGQKPKVEYEEYDGPSTLYGKVMVKYFTDASEIIPLFLQGQGDYALVGEPAATQLMRKLVEKGFDPGTPLDLQQLWKEVTESDKDGYPQASLIVKKSVVDAAFRSRLDGTLNANAAYLEANAGEVKGVLNGAGSTLTVDFNKEIIKRCNIAFTDGYSAKSDIETFLANFKGMEEFLPLSPEIFGISETTV